MSEIKSDTAKCGRVPGYFDFMEVVHRGTGLETGEMKGLVGFLLETRLKRNVQFTVVWLFILVATTAYGQDVALPKFRMRLKDGRRIEGTRGNLTGDTLTGRDSDGERFATPRHEILLLDGSAGTQAAKGAMIGGMIGLMTALLTVQEVETDPNPGWKADPGVLIAGSAIGGAVIGLIAGSMITEWHAIPLGVAIGRRGRDPLMLVMSHQF